MFKDYYKILEISSNASDTEIKKVFKKLALEWHPDRNLNMDTTKKMQELNEAYLILKDAEAKLRYDREYLNYYKTKKATESENRKSDKNNTFSNESKNNHTEYEFQDEELYRWTRNAEKQAVELAKRTIEDLKGMVKVGTKGALESMAYQIGGVIILLMIFSFIRTCN
jgi:curved DNA-binding protein CbpA